MLFGKMQLWNTPQTHTADENFNSRAYYVLNIICINAYDRQLQLRSRRRRLQANII